MEMQMAMNMQMTVNWQVTDFPLLFDAITINNESQFLSALTLLFILSSMSQLLLIKKVKLSIQQFLCCQTPRHIDNKQKDTNQEQQIKIQNIVPPSSDRNNLSDQLKHSQNIQSPNNIRSNQQLLSNREKPSYFMTTCKQLVFSFLYHATLTVSNIALMLIIMSMNGYIILGVGLGTVIGKVTKDFIEKEQETMMKKGYQQKQKMQCCDF